MVAGGRGAVCNRAGRVEVMFPRLKIVFQGLAASAMCLMTGAVASAEVDFDKEIRPILERHCHECHGALRRSGGLRMDVRTGALQGGDTGVSLLEAGRDNNEIYRRIVSSDRDFVMPRKRDALSPVEIETIGRWADAGADWPERAVDRPGLSWGKLWHRFGAPLSGVLLACLVLAAAVEWGRFRHRRGGGGAMGAVCARVPRTAYVMGALALGLLSLSKEYERLREQQRRMAFELREAAYFRVFGSPPQPVPYRGVPRFGGVFYRGNDERDEKLFNGGVYRTCDFILSLCDRNGRKLVVGDPLPEAGLAFELEIRRSPGATRQPYADHIMSKVFFTGQDLNRLDAVFEGNATRLEIVESEERWRAFCPIGEAKAAEAGDLAGTTYLYLGDSHEGKPLVKRPIYGVVYRIRVEAGRVAEGSELWIGNLVLNDALELPPSGRGVRQEQWLGLDPLPEIQGTNTTDPDLLGVRDYQGLRK